MIPQPLRSATYQTLIGLLAATGMRVGEALRLDRADIDWADGVLRIRESKFGKSRLVPLDPSAVDALERYDHTRERLLPDPSTDGFFVSLRGTRVIYETVWPTHRRLCEHAGVGAGSPVTPRIHDHRHSLCGQDAARLVSGRALTSRPGSRGCRRISGIASPATPTTTCPPRRSCSRTPPACSTTHRRCGHDPRRTDPAGVLHRPSDPAAASQPANDRVLPRHAPAAALLHPGHDRQTARQARLGRPQRDRDLRVPRASRDRPSQHRRGPGTCG